MIDRIVVSPQVDGKFGVMQAAGLLDANAPDERKPPEGGLWGLRTDLVAGTGFEPVTFRL
jgi:hypothetical protein